jgi:ankyrin repeat protein
VDLGSTDLNEGLWNACEWGQLDCARLMVELGAKELNRGLRWACGWGHADCARLMVSLGATSCEACGGAKHDFAP